MSDFEIILSTCSIIEIPPKPSKKEHIIILIEIHLLGIPLINFTPFVSSIIPETMEVDMLVLFIPNILKIGVTILENMCKIPLLFKIDIITLNKTTNPPIIIIVLIADIMLLLKTSPKLEKDATPFKLLEEVLLLEEVSDVWL